MKLKPLIFLSYIVIIGSERRLQCRCVFLFSCLFCDLWTAWHGKPQHRSLCSLTFFSSGKTRHHTLQHTSQRAAVPPGCWKSVFGNAGARDICKRKVLQGLSFLLCSGTFGRPTQGFFFFTSSTRATCDWISEQQNDRMTCFILYVVTLTSTSESSDTWDTWQTFSYRPDSADRTELLQKATWCS